MVKFKNTNLRTGQTFKCALKKMTCGHPTESGTPCKKQVAIGIKKCHLHRHVQIKKSLIKDAGKGVFAKKDYAVGYRIGYYRGEVLSNIAHSKRYGGDKKDHAPYSLQGSKTKVVDSACRRGVMSMVNGTRRKRDANAIFKGRMQSKTTGTIPVVAIKPLAKGEEILVHYGGTYFSPSQNAYPHTR